MFIFNNKIDLAFYSELIFFHKFSLVFLNTGFSKLLLQTHNVVIQVKRNVWFLNQN